MKWFDGFFGTKDKAQRKRTEEVSQYVHEQKETFTAEMGKIQNQAKKAHRSAERTHKKSVRLLEVVESVTAQIARATGN